MMILRLRNTLHSMAYYLWCRWTNHRGASWYTTELVKVDDETQVMAFASCALCHRVDTYDLLACLSMLGDDVKRDVLAELDIKEDNDDRSSG